MCAVKYLDPFYDESERFQAVGQQLLASGVCGRHARAPDQLLSELGEEGRIGHAENQL